MKITIALVLIFGVGAFVLRDQLDSRISPAKAEDIAKISSYEYTEIYTSSTYGFSFKYPPGFSVTESREEGFDVIIVSNPETKIGIQILITPVEADLDITEEIVKEDIPDIKVSDPQPVEIVAGRKGLAFVGNNENFGGKSREVWFVYNKYLYQITTYDEFGQVVEKLLENWKFDAAQ